MPAGNTRRRSQKGGVRSKTRKTHHRRGLTLANTIFASQPIGKPLQARKRTVHFGPATIATGPKNLISENILRALERHSSADSLHAFVNVLQHLMKERYDDDDVQIFLSIMDPTIREAVQENEPEVAIFFSQDDYEDLLEMSEEFNEKSIEESVRFLRRLVRKAKKAKGVDKAELDKLAGVFMRAIYSTLKAQSAIVNKIEAIAAEDDELADLLGKLAV